MSTAAVNRYPVARRHHRPRPARAEPGSGPQGPHSAFAGPLAPRKRRAPFVVLCFGILAVALMAVLVLNISVSTAQYQLVQLRSDQLTLTKQNQDLTQQVQNFDAPQNLAAKATELGMVASTGKGQIDLSTLSVTGKAKAGGEGRRPGRRHRRARRGRAADHRSARHQQRAAREPQTGGRHTGSRLHAPAQRRNPPRRQPRPTGRRTPRRVRPGPRRRRSRDSNPSRPPARQAARKHRGAETRQGTQG